MDQASTQPQPLQFNSAEILAHSEYVRERIAPSIRDAFYLCLSDLKEFVAQQAGKFSGTVLDYGCGGSPYRSMFKSVSRYIRADMLPGEGVDLVLSSDGLTNEPDQSCQGVVSFQVLEHVPDPGAYLDECHRILSNDGLLLLTTHGLFLEHKCPDDFFRWTSQGLESLLSSRGFSVLDSVKMTTGLRGLFQLQHHVVHELISEGLAYRVLRKAYQILCMPAFNLFAKLFLDRKRIVPAHAPENTYVLVGVLARKSS